MVVEICKDLAPKADCKYTHMTWQMSIATLGFFIIITLPRCSTPVHLYDEHELALEFTVRAVAF